MANRQNICKQGLSLHSSKLNLSRIESFAKEEDMDRILQETEIKLVGCSRVPQVNLIRKQTMCESVNTPLTVCFAF